MHSEGQSAQHIELTHGISFPGEVFFDSEALMLIGSYADELSAHRARKTWSVTLETCFLLEHGYDFTLRVDVNAESERFVLTCTFKSACARYAFWRLTNDQAPEAQYIIETAHIPSAVSSHMELQTASDLRAVLDQQLSSCLEPSLGKQRRTITSLLDALRRLVRLR